MGAILQKKNNEINNEKLLIKLSLICLSGEDAKETLKIQNPRQIFESKISRLEKIIFKMNCLAVNEKRFITLTSENKSIHGEFFLN